jgi:hypothetical protein
LYLSNAKARKRQTLRKYNKYKKMYNKTRRKYENKLNRIMQSILHRNGIHSDNMKKMTHSISSVGMPERKIGSYNIAYGKDINSCSKMKYILLASLLPYYALLTGFVIYGNFGV